MRAFARRPVARAAGETLAAWATEDFLAEHALVGLTLERFRRADVHSVEHVGSLPA
jgi:hypothetical protein